MDKASLCNMALGLVGESEYVADSKEWRACELYLPLVYGELLAVHDWSFARRYKVLEAGEFGYALPDDCLRVVELSGLDNWRICGRHVRNEGEGAQGEVAIFYVSNSLSRRGDVPDTQPRFARALYTRLGACLAVPVAGDQNLRGALEQEAQMLLAEAVTDDVRQDGSNDQHPLSRMMQQSIVRGDC